MSSSIAGLGGVPGTPGTAASAGAAAAEESPSAGGGSEFFHTLGSVMNQVQGLQGDAANSVQELLQGNGQDIHAAMIAVEKADLSFQLMMQVRNKIIQAYQTVSQMQF